MKFHQTYVFCKYVYQELRKDPQNYLKIFQLQSNVSKFMIDKLPNWISVLSCNMLVEKENKLLVSKAC